MKRKLVTLGLLLTAGASILFYACTNGPVYPHSPTAIVGADFENASTQALQAYAEYKAGNVDITWALSKMFDAYTLYGHTSADVQDLIHAWAGHEGDSQKLAAKLARIFGASSAPPEQKMAALAQISRKVAAKKSP